MMAPAPRDRGGVVLRACPHGAVLAMVNAGSILAGFMAYNLMRPANQIAVQLPVAVIVTVVTFAAWCAIVFRWVTPLKSWEWLWTYFVALPWSVFAFVLVHRATQGYLTSFGNIVALWLFQLAVNPLALLAGKVCSPKHGVPQQK